MALNTLINDLTLKENEILKTAEDGENHFYIGLMTIFLQKKRNNSLKFMSTRDLRGRGLSDIS